MVEEVEPREAIEITSSSSSSSYVAREMAQAAAQNQLPRLPTNTRSIRKPRGKRKQQQLLFWGNDRVAVHVGTIWLLKLEN